MRVYWTDRAKQRLKEIQVYIAQEDTQVAQQIIHQILIRSQQIAELPFSGRKVPEYQRHELREMLEKPYRIIYRLHSEQVDVLTVMHYRQLLPNDYKNL